MLILKLGIGSINMSRKDYYLLARVVKDSFKDHLPTAILLKTELIENFCIELEKENPKFRRDFFIKACTDNFQS